MSYDVTENSATSGAPVELYEWSFGADVWRQTSADADQVQGGYTWSTTLLEREEIEDGGEINRATLSIKGADDHPVADLFRAGSPEGVIMLRIWRLHRGDTDAQLVWMGRVLNCEWSGIEATLSAEPIATSLRQPGLRRLYSRLCPHALYGSFCGVDRASKAVAATVTGVSGLILTVSASHTGTAGYYAGGMVAWTTGGRTLYRGIESHSGGQLRLVSPLTGLSVGANLTIYPGCDKTLKTCREKFSNQPNFGGYKWIPGVNPFTTSVF